MGLQDSIVGLDQLRELLATQGIEARESTPGERARLGSGFFSRDRSCLTVLNRSFDMISLRLEGGVGPLENLGSRAGSFSVGALPIKSRTVLPIKAHYIVLCDEGQAREELAAELKLRRQGLLARRVVGGAWVGDALAATLNSDRAGLDLLVSCLGPRDGVAIIPDRRSSCVRIVHRSSRVLDYSLFKPGLVSFEQGDQRPGMLEALEGLAARIREALPR